MNGTVRDVPSLNAPGFIKAVARGQFNDASDTVSGDLILKVRSTTSEYTGFRVSFAAGTLSPDYACAGGSTIPFSGGCFKARFTIPRGQEFSEVHIPFKSFSDHWSPATGDQITACADDPEVCPTAHDLGHVKHIELWAEGVKGEVHLEVESISAAIPEAIGQNDRMKRIGMSKISDEYNICNGKVQSDLLYGFAHRDTADYLPVEVDEGETLAEAVCCDSRMLPYAEPQHTYAAPDIRLFSRIDQHGITTFYDSVCGLPLFRAPIGRTLEEFRGDTDEHGWPSFRAEEVVAGNVITDKSEERVFSVCGTHIGSYLPDEAGDRWCIDLACISGQSAEPLIEIIY